MTRDLFRPLLPLVLSLNAGYVDTAGFLALQGLFTAHVTGNFVTLGASLVLGTSGAVAKLLALPVFCLVVILARLLSTALIRRQLPALKIILGVKFAFLVIGAALAIHFGPFTNGDAVPAVVTGMVLVAAMAIQNAAHRIHLASAPPSTLMTGTTTQIMIDLADMLQGPKPETGTPGARLARMSTNIVAFALGCASAALLYARFGVWCFVLPPALACVSLFLRMTTEAESRKT
ncbi:MULTISPECIES: YoaK family protein [Bradyrhizobium]|uniref:YoaK family protein n=1 Tax=Bradyrhizobium TaxID=374 RepID=UPI0004174D73|nr:MULTISPECIES: YoaK family protein [Bradyrhizobium]KIU43343.1 membrane protein [Bradyrhizobium elkanii]MBK5654499.1 DUF1275 domain-containing protein [Rhizobium sp.]OCX29817.1 hypothetical protein QU42_15620 [Bradyrhizobium sp. UASWS1016]